MKPDGSGRHRLSLPVTGEVKHPDWSPDGLLLSFVLGDAVWVAGVDGADAHKVAACAGEPCSGLDFPAWSPDGTRVAFTRYNNPPVAAGPPSSSAIEIVELSSGKRTVITETERLELVDQPRWSRDAQSLVLQVERFADDGTETGAAIATVPVSGGTPKPITDFTLFATYPDWNPTSDRIVFVAHDVDPSGAPVGLYTVNADASGLAPIS